jgi:DNA-directed RNA polymerase specialized sigma24 family protein
MNHICAPPADIDPIARELIRHKIRRLVGNHGFTRTDAADLAQDLALHAHVASSKYDPARGARSTFFDRLLTRKVASIVAAATAQKRDRRREGPLSDAERPSRDPSNRLHLKLDVRFVVNRLPRDLRDLAHRFAHHGENESEACRALRWTRSQVRHRRALIAQHLTRAGLAPDRVRGRQ